MNTSNKHNCEPTRDFLLEVCDISPTEACIVFEHLPYTVSRKNIEFFELRLWKEGSTRNIDEIKKVSKRNCPNSSALHETPNRPIFEVEIKGN